MSSGGLIPLTQDSTTDSINFLGVTINLIETWLKYLEEKYIWRFQEYKDNMKYHKLQRGII